MNTPIAPYPSNEATPRRGVLVVDDDPRVRQGLRALIEAETDLSVVGEAASAAEALDYDRRLRPAVIVLDLILPGCDDGISLLRQLARDPSRPVIAISVRDTLAQPALRAGAHAFVEKGSAPEGVIVALRAAVAC